MRIGNFRSELYCDVSIERLAHLSILKTISSENTKVAMVQCKRLLLRMLRTWEEGRTFESHIDISP